MSEQRTSDQYPTWVYCPHCCSRIEQPPSNPLHTELARRFFKECSDRSLKFDPDERAIVVMFAAWLDGRASDVASAGGISVPPVGQGFDPKAGT